ncbi:MAG: glycosyltransferase [Pedobacter sp.]|nr:MAG: glycosyltransferase [Pedobacter sp.]
MEILFVSHKYPPAMGGMEKQSFELIRQMGMLTTVHSIVYDGRESRFRFFSQLGKRITQVVNDNPGISIIHFNDGLMGAFSMFYRRHNNLKRAVTLHGLDVVFPGFIYQKFIFSKFNNFDLIFAVSSATALECKVRGISAEKIVVVNNGVDTSIKSNNARIVVDELLFQKYHTDIAGKRVLVGIGRPVKRKGFSWFIKNILPGLHKDFVLLLIGPVQEKESGFSRLLRFLPPFISRKIELFLGAPGDETELRKLLKKTNDKSRVVRMGKLPQDDIDAILGIADGFIMPNIEVRGDMEGFGLVCLEACMRGTKVFASASGGITDAIIHGRNGMLLPPGHITSWVFSLNSIIEDQNPLLTAEDIIVYTKTHFGWQKMADQYYWHFKNLL